MTGPRLDPSWAQPITPSGKATLDSIIADYDATTNKRNAGWNELIHSGIADTLQSMLGPHKFDYSQNRPGWGFLGDRPWNGVLAVNHGKYNDTTSITFNKEYLDNSISDVARHKYLKEGAQSMDDPGTDIMFTLAHEMGHTADEMPGLFPDVVDEYGRNAQDPEHGDLDQKMTLFQQWKQVVSKKANLKPDEVRGLTHRGWVAPDGTPEAGAPEMFADAFAVAVRNLRRTWDNKDSRKLMDDLRFDEGNYPGVTYLTKWLTTQPPYKQHPLGKVLRGSSP